MRTQTFAQNTILKKIGEKQNCTIFQDFGYGDEHSESPYGDYLDYLDGESYPEGAN